MEEFDYPIACDYFHQRRVEGVKDGPGGDGDPVWMIMFEHDGILFNYDPLIPKPDNIVGLAYTHTTYGLPEGTNLYFGEIGNTDRAMVTINPMQYAIADPHYTKGQTVFAQRSRFNMPPTIPDHPDDRIAEGPLGERLDEDDGA
jgi:hypothetical protein